MSPIANSRPWFVGRVVRFAGAGEPGALSDVGKTAVAILPVQAIPISGVAARELRRRFYRVIQATAVYKENVKQPVIVEIEQGHSAAHSLYQVLLRRGRIAVHEVDARRPDDAQDQLGGEQGDNRKNDSRGDSPHGSNSNIVTALHKGAMGDSIKWRPRLNRATRQGGIEESC